MFVSSWNFVSETEKWVAQFLEPPDLSSVQGGLDFYGDFVVSFSDFGPPMQIFFLKRYLFPANSPTRNSFGLFKKCQYWNISSEIRVFERSQKNCANCINFLQGKSAFMDPLLNEILC